MPGGAEAGMVNAIAVNPTNTVIEGDGGGNNDEAWYSDNFAWFDYTMTSVAPVDTVLHITDTNGVHEYEFDGMVTNDTGVSWEGFRIELGFGTGENFAPASFPGLDFDTPSLDPTPEFDWSSPTIHTDTLIQWDVAVSALVNAIFYYYSIDLPDLDANYVPASAIADGGYLVTVRQMALVPEPGGVVCWLGALAALGVRRRRRTS